MSTHTHTPPTEGGNAVTLTLLGLAVAILAGVVVLYIIGRSAPEQVTPLIPSEEIATSSDVVIDPRAGWQRYSDSLYSFTIQYPPGWLVATGTEQSVPVITFAPGVLDASSTDTYLLSSTRLSVYPEGTPINAIADSEAQSSIIVPVPQATAKDYLLTSKRPWATIARFEKIPPTWSPTGYVQMRARVEDEVVTYVRGESEIPEAEFDPRTGDQLKREGYVDPAIRTLEEDMLRSFSFVVEEAVTEQPADLIEVTSPKEHALVSNPLMVEGRARGGWYFEGSFPVQLLASTGEKLAEVPAMAQGEWMTEEFTPFVVSLSFDAGTATSGTLVLMKSNPSGLSEHDTSVTIPVEFVNE